MLPIVGALIGQGLNILAGAVATKGKDYIQDKLGVNLEDALGTENGKLRLRQLELEHEQFLLQQVADSEVRAFTDIASARDMNTRINESMNASWLSKNIASILALIAITGGGSMLAWSPESDVRTAAVGLITMVLGFYFGSSRSSKGKDDVIADMARNSK